MDIASMICTSLTVTCVKSTLTPIKNHIGYVFNHRSKLQLLRERVERLKDAMEAIQHYVDDAQRNGEEILDDVREWLFRAEEMIHECVLGNIAGIGELKNLEILSLLGSDIEALPD
ncbi:hypothetical protein V6N13_088193 [Hibiscus sabdariffa]